MIYRVVWNPTNKVLINSDRFDKQNKKLLVSCPDGKQRLFIVKIKNNGQKNSSIRLSGKGIGFLFYKFITGRTFCKALAEDIICQHNSSESSINLVSTIKNQAIDSKVSFEKNKISNKIFKDCQIDLALFSEAEIENTLFENCNFTNTSFLNAKLKNCKFTNCNFHEVMFVGTNFDRTNFVRCNINETSFEDATLSKTSFLNSKLVGSHFLDASVHDSSIKKTKLENTVFFGLRDSFDIDKESIREHVMTKPVAALLVITEKKGFTTPMASFKLKKVSGVIPLRISCYCSKVDASELNKEVESLLAHKKETLKPIPQELLDLAKDKSSTYSSCETIISKSRKLGQHVNCIYLPGAPVDMQPELYGAYPHPKTHTSKDYRRAILEFSLVDEARNNGIPLMGVCKGHQVVNVFHGAQVVQHVSGQHRLQRFNLEEEAKQLFGEKLEKPFVSLAAHHQAVIEPSYDSEIKSVLLYKNYTMLSLDQISKHFTIS